MTQQLRLPGKGWGPKPPPPTEHKEQVAFIQRCRDRAKRDPRAEILTYIAAVPNGAYYGPDAKTRSIIGARMKAEGLVEGYEDLQLLAPMPRPDDDPAPPACPEGWYCGWLGELKRLEGGRVEDEQAEWHAKHRAKGYRVDVEKGADALFAALCRYLGIPEEYDGR